MANLALVYQKQGRLKEAEELSLAAVERLKDTMGDGYFETRASMTNLAVTYYKQGRFKEAEELAVRILGLRKKGVSSRNYRQALGGMEELSEIIQDPDRLQEAAEVGVQVLEMLKSMLGNTSRSEPNTPAVQATAFGLAGLAGLVAWWVRPS